MKYCSQCNVEKEFKYFNKDSKGKNGLRADCKDCNQKYKQNYHDKNPSKILLSDAKHRAKKSNMEFDLIEDDLIIPLTCPYLGIPLFNSNTRQSDNSISLDRIDSTKGYTKDNIIICSWRANHIKGNASSEELFKIATKLKELENDRRKNS
jgi:hypothetical protein